MSQTKIIQTRGRPKKQDTKSLSPVYKEMFSDNSAIIHACSLIYVFEIFLSTKNEKRVGHKDGGFTIYDKTDNAYCFDNLGQVLKQWGYDHLLDIQQLQGLIKLLPAIGPKIILKQTISLIDQIIKYQEQGLNESQIITTLSNPASIQQLNQKYPYMRFTPNSLQILKLQKNQNVQNIISQRVNQLWKPFINIFVHTILNTLQGNIKNQYFKPFFSDADQPSNTFIGQLNLQQIVATIHDSIQQSQSPKHITPFQEKYEGFRKYRKIETPQNKVEVIPIVQQKDQSISKPTKQIIRPIISVPSFKKHQLVPKQPQSPQIYKKSRQDQNQNMLKNIKSEKKQIQNSQKPIQINPMQKQQNNQIEEEK